MEIMSDNGKPFVVALAYLEHKYHIKHIRIAATIPVQMGS